MADIRNYYGSKGDELRAVRSSYMDYVNYYVIRIQETPLRGGWTWKKLRKTVHREWMMVSADTVRFYRDRNVMPILQEIALSHPAHSEMARVAVANGTTVWILKDFLDFLDFNYGGFWDYLKNPVFRSSDEELEELRRVKIGLRSLPAELKSCREGLRIALDIWIMRVWRPRAGEMDFKKLQSLIAADFTQHCIDSSSLSRQCKKDSTIEGVHDR